MLRFVAATAGPGNDRFRRSATCLDELLEGLDYYGVDVRHRRCAIWSLRVAVATRIAAATARLAVLRDEASGASI